MKCTEVKLVFEDEQEELEANKLGDFLFQFRAAYAVAAHVLGRSEARSVLARQADAERRLNEHLMELSLQDLDRLFTSDLGQRRLVTRRVSRDSSMEIVFYGLASALVGAVILSGGRFRGLGMEAQLRPLGDGIRKLRAALTRSSGADLAYASKTRRVKLSRGQYNELMKYDPSSKGRGGFQGLLIKLQSRVNRNTRVIELSSDDMDRILRYGRHPRRGGWQSSIRKIFGGHLGFGD